MLAGLDMAQLSEKNNQVGGLAQVATFGSISSELMIKQMILQEMLKYGRNASLSPVEEENQFVSQLVDSIMDSVILKNSEQTKEKEGSAQPSYDDWLSQSQVVGSFALKDFFVNDEGFAEYQEVEEEEEIIVDQKQRDLEKINSTKDNEIVSQPRNLKEVKSFALYDIEIEYYEEFLEDLTSSDEEDHLSSSSSA